MSRNNCRRRHLAADTHIRVRSGGEFLATTTSVGSRICGRRARGIRSRAARDVEHLPPRLERLCRRPMPSRGEGRYWGDCRRHDQLVTPRGATEHHQQLVGPWSRRDRTRGRAGFCRRRALQRFQLAHQQGGCAGPPARSRRHAVGARPRRGAGAEASITNTSQPTPTCGGTLLIVCLLALVERKVLARTALPRGTIDAVQQESLPAARVCRELRQAHPPPAPATALRVSCPPRPAEVREDKTPLACGRGHSGWSPAPGADAGTLVTTPSAPATLRSSRMRTACCAGPCRHAQ